MIQVKATCHKSDIPCFSMFKGGTNSKPFTIDGTTYAAGTLRFEKQQLRADVVNYSPKEQVYVGVYLFEPTTEPGSLKFDFSDLPTYHPEEISDVSK